MNTQSFAFFKSWIRRVLTLVALGGVLMAVQLGMSRRHRLIVGSLSLSPTPETRALPDPVAKAEHPQVDIPVAARPKESSTVSAETNVVPLVSAPATEAVAASMVYGQIVAVPLARAVNAARSDALVGVGPSGDGQTPTLDPPLAFTVDAKSLAPQQQSALATIQDQFLKAIGDADQNPADPSYNERWRNAQYVADQAYRADFGWTAFVQMQLERARNSYTEIQLP
jgi:hypothetical protein